MQEEFSWIIDQKLAGMPRPGMYGSLGADLRFLGTQGISLLVSLTRFAPDAAILAKHGIESLHLPVTDFHPPTLDQQLAFVEAASQVLSNGGRVGVHCAAGMGRTGTMLATYLVYGGSSADEAIEKVRNLRPGSIETAAQEAAVSAFEDRLRK